MARASLFGGGPAHGVELLLRLAEFGQDLERLGGLGLVDAAHREADMDQHPIADAGFDRMLRIDDAGDVDLPSARR